MKYLLPGITSLLVATHVASAATVAHYEFNGTGIATNGAVITDATGNHHGTVAGGDLDYGLHPLVGSYLSFELDGADRVLIPGAPGLVFGTDQGYTIEVIFRTTMTTAIGSLIAKGTDVSNPDSQWWLRYQGGGQLRGLVEGVDNATEDSATSSAATPVNDGNWHHVALVYNGTISPKRLDIYVDGKLNGSDANIGTLGIVGGVDTDPVLIGEFASLGSNRSFLGDIAEVRMSDAPLTPAEFLPVGVTYISDITPTNNASFLPASTVASFVVNSPSVGVAQTNIHVALNGSDITSQLAFAGTDAQRTVTLPVLAANQIYRMEITVFDLATNQVKASVTFNTFVNDILFIEGEDYNYDSGQFIDNPQLSSTPAANNYLDRFGVEGIDYHQTNTPALGQYRIGDQVGTAVSPDALRQAYLDAQMTDPGVTDYMSRDHANTEWLNYTRTFPANSYRVYARVARGGTVPIVMQLDEVTSGSTTASQTLAPIGAFKHPPTGSAVDFDFIPLTDALGREVAVSLSGQRTLRLTMISGTAGMNVNYLLFVPPGGVQPPFVASVSPVAGAGNEPNNAPILISLRNADTSVNTGTIQLRVDGSLVTPAVTPTAIGADLSYTPSLLTTGWHTVTLTFADSAATSVTNEWQFHVANQAVRGYWRFNEQVTGNFASTNAGAILDASGNTRHGTVNAEDMAYVVGSVNYGNSPALKFTTGPDRIVVPDSAGSFNFTGSFTFEAVVRTASGSTSAALLAKNGTGDGEGEYWWRIPGATGGKQRLAMNGYFASGTNTLNDGNWHHVAVVYDQAASQIRLYADYQLDGFLDGVVIDRPVGRPADLQLGGFIGTTTSEFDGDVDLIRVSDGALTTAEFIPTSVALQPVVKSLLPGSDARNVAPTSRIEVEFQNRDTAVVLSSLKLFVDGVDVTASATRTEDASGAKISYVPAAPLAAGLHTATTTFNDNAAPASSLTNSWSFTVVSSVPVLGLYQFNEESPGNSADTATNAILDASGNARHATASAALPYVAGSPDYGTSSALQFFVGGGPVIIPDAAGVFNFSATQSITIEAVIRTFNIGENSVGCIAAKQGASPGEWWWRINANGTQQFWAQNGSESRNVAGATALNDGNWHHLAAVFDGTAHQLRVYVDYNLDGSAAADFAAPGNIGNAKDVWIGAFQNLDREFDGDIDAVRITGEALDPSWFIPLGGIPATPASVTLMNVSQAGRNISFSFATETGRSYVIESVAALGATWGDVEAIPGDGTTKTVSYAVTGDRKFFRVRTQ